MAATVKEEETFEPVLPDNNWKPDPSKPVDVIELSSSGDESPDAGDEEEFLQQKKTKREDENGVVLPLGFLEPLTPDEALWTPEPIAVEAPESRVLAMMKPCRQFWKAGDFDGDVVVVDSDAFVNMDHVRVHPKFLHSNATSHKWALGAFAELMDNALDEACHGATFVNIDVLDNKKDGTKMLLVEDNGGGMDPDKMRQCMSLGYSAKSKMANTIGQYGNGFKTSTMRLGADVIVFSRCHGKDGKSPTQSIGMLSYTFLRNTGKEDIVVPMLDYEKGGSNWHKMTRMSSTDWSTNLGTILQWSPYTSEATLLDQFRSMSDQGTRIVVYNLWDDDQGELELDFNTNKKDIQLRGVNRDEKKIEMATQFPNSRHFLTYQHSLRSYASIIYRRLPANFRMILRGEEIQHHNIVNDMMLTQEITYRPQHSYSNLSVKDLVAVVTIGFVKDAKDHIDVQGFNVYHKNRLIKPFWRVWNATGSDGRGVIGVLEADFVEPAHDKQGFERTTVLSRLENRLIHMQKNFWSTYCHKIGYAPRRNKKLINGSQDKDRDSSPEEFCHSSLSPRSSTSRKGSYVGTMPSVRKSMDSSKLQSNDKSYSFAKTKSLGKSGYCSLASSAKPGGAKYVKGHLSPSREIGSKSKEKSKRSCHDLSKRSNPSSDSDSDIENNPDRLVPGGLKCSPARIVIPEVVATLGANSIKSTDALSVDQLNDKNHELKERIKRLRESMLNDLQHERERGRSLTEKLEATESKLEAMNKEQEALIDMFSEERSRRDKEEEELRKKLKDASSTIQELLQKSGESNLKTELG